MSIWKVNGKPAAELGIGSITLNRKSQAPDECILRVLKPFDVEGPFAHGSTVQITKDDVPYFSGRCESDPRSGASEGESHTVRLLGPWWYLENRIFRQAWKQIDPTTTPPGKKDIQTTYVILGMNTEGAFIASGAVMKEAINFCIGSGAPLQLGTIMDGAQLPLDEANDITCAEVLHRCLRWTPDAVVWFDYSTTPPTINIQRRAQLEAVTLPATAESEELNVKRVECEPCHTLKLDGVRLYFCVDSNAFPSLIQTAGNVDSFQTLEQTIRLGGAAGNIILNKIEVGELPDTQDDVDWWKDKHPWLKSDDIKELSLHDGDIGDTHGYGKYLLPGYSITEWMKDHQGVASAECVATVRADYTMGGTDYVDQVLTFKYTATNADNKTYTWGEGGVPAEVPPTDLAGVILSACSTLHYQGSLALVEEECGRGASLMGCVLNLTAGQSAWSTMRALITGVSEDLFFGRTTITFGPPPCLGAGDMMALARMNRIRVPAGSAGSKKNGGHGADDTPSVGGTGGGDAPTSGIPKMSKLTIADKDDSSKKVTIDPTPGSPLVVLTGVKLDSGGLVFSNTNLIPKGDVYVAGSDNDDITIPITTCGTYGGGGS